MSSDFSFIPHSSKGHSVEFAVEGSRYAFTQGSLADTGRPYKANDGALGVFFEFTDREVLDDSLFYLCHAVVVVIQNVLGISSKE